MGGAAPADALELVLVRLLRTACRFQRRGQARHIAAQLADRAGMIVSPKAAQAEGDKFGAKPVCAGPFRFVERIAQDHVHELVDK